MSVIWDIAIYSIILILGISIYSSFTHKPRLIFWGIFFIFCLAVIIYGSFIEPKELLINNYDIQLSKQADSNNKISIALISDLHLSPYQNELYLKNIADKINANSPDLVLIAGDFIYNKKSIEKLDQLKEFKEKIKVPIYAVLGNHEYNVRRYYLKNLDQERADAVYQKLNNAGIEVLRNEYRLLSFRNTSFWLIGVDSWIAGKADLDKSLKNTIDNYPKLLLAHSPDITSDIKPEYGIDLTLSGHTHGGQIRLPIIGSVPPIPTNMGRKYDKGFFNYEKSPLFITTGVGVSGPRARLLVPPEIAMLHISF